MLLDRIKCNWKDYNYKHKTKCWCRPSLEILVTFNETLETFLPLSKQFLYKLLRYVNTNRIMQIIQRWHYLLRNKSSFYKENIVQNRLKIATASAFSSQRRFRLYTYLFLKILHAINLQRHKSFVIKMRYKAINYASMKLELRTNNNTT